MALKRERHAVERVRVWRERLASSEGHELENLYDLDWTQ
jgi:hypothetical protein